MIYLLKSELAALFLKTKLMIAPEVAKSVKNIERLNISENIAVI